MTDRTTIKMDSEGNIYAPMTDDLRKEFPSEFVITFQGRDITYYLEPRVFMPQVDSDRGKAVLDSHK